MKLYFLPFLVALIGCASSYTLVGETGECESSSLSIGEQAKIMQEAASIQGLNCYIRPVELSNGESLYRSICNTVQKGLVPYTFEITEDKQSCELAKNLLRKNPLLGIETVSIQRMEESSVWMIGIKDSSCTPYPYGLDKMLGGLAEQTGKACRTSLWDYTFQGESVRNVICGDMKTGSAWIVTESEKACQSIIKQNKNTTLWQDLQSPKI